MKAISEKTSKILGVKTYVLEDGRVVVSATHMQEAFGLARASAPPTEGDVAQVPRFLAAKNLNPFISAELTAWLKSPAKFSLPGGGLAYGYDSDVITDIAIAIMKASVDGALYSRQHKMAQAAEAFVAATSKVGSRFALLDEHGMQPRAGAAQEVRGQLEEQVKTLRTQMEAKDRTIELIMKESAAQSARQGELERLVRTMVCGILVDAPETLRWVLSTIEDIATLRRFGTPDTAAQSRGAVHEELRRAVDHHHLQWEDFSLAKLDELRRWLKWFHRDALKVAKRRGFGGGGSWTQPPLPFTGDADEDEAA